MDFKKIELIFLSVFIAIDIFLFVIILQTPNLSLAKGNNTAQSIRQEMTADNISVGNLSSKKASGYYLASKVSDVLNERAGELKNQQVTYSATEHVLTSDLTQPITGRDDQDLVAAAKKFTTNAQNVINGTQYVYAAPLSSKSALVFVQKTKYGVIAAEKGQLIFEINNNKITKYTQSYQNQLTIVREKQETISAEQAVSNLYMFSQLPGDTSIESAELGYTELTQVKEQTIFIPTWIVKIKNKNTGNIQFKEVNAFNGTVIALNQNSNLK